MTDAKSAPAKPLMGECPDTKLPIVLATGLVPCRVLVGEAGYGLRAGEVRGLTPVVADTMIKRKSAELAVDGEDREPASPKAPAKGRK